MRLASYLVDGQPRAGVIASDQTLVGVSDLVAGGPTDMLGVLAAGPSLWDRLRAASASARGGLALSGARLVAPVPPAPGFLGRGATCSASVGTTRNTLPRARAFVVRTTVRRICPITRRSSASSRIPS